MSDPEHSPIPIVKKAERRKPQQISVKSSRVASKLLSKSIQQKLIHEDHATQQLKTMENPNYLNNIVFANDDDYFLGQNQNQTQNHSPSHYQNIRMDQSFEKKFRVVSVFEEKEQLDSALKESQYLDSVIPGTLSRLRCSKVLSQSNGQGGLRGRHLMQEFGHTIEKRQRQEIQRVRSAENGKESGFTTDRDFEDFEQDQKSQGVIDTNEAHQQDVKRLMYHLIKKKYEQYISSQKSGMLRSLKGEATYKSRYKVSKDKNELRLSANHQAQQVRSIIARTQSDLSQSTAMRKGNKPRPHQKGFVDIKRMIKRPQIGSKHGIMPDACAKDVDYHYEEIFKKNWTIEHQNYDFGKSIPHGQEKLDKTKTLQYQKNIKDSDINYQKIFKKFEEHELERIYNENLKHQIVVSGASQDYEDYIKEEMFKINRIVHRKICKLGKNINELSDWFYLGFGLDPETFEIPRSKKPNFR